MEPLIIHTENEETIILCGTDNINDCSDWNSDGELVIVFEGQHHDRTIETIDVARRPWIRTKLGNRRSAYDSDTNQRCPY